MTIENARDILKQNVRIQDVLWALKINANGGKISCFIHDDKHPSMSVYKDRVHCHACQFDEDVIGVVSRVMNLSFVDSIRWLLDRFMPGVRLDHKFDYEVKERITLQRNVYAGLKAWRNKAYDRLCFLYRECQKSKKLPLDTVGFYAACEFEGLLENLIDVLASTNELDWLAVYRDIGEGWGL